MPYETTELGETTETGRQAGEWTVGVWDRDEFGPCAANLPEEGTVDGDERFVWVATAYKAGASWRLNCAPVHSAKTLLRSLGAYRDEAGRALSPWMWMEATVPSLPPVEPTCPT